MSGDAETLAEVIADATVPRLPDYEGRSNLGRIQAEAVLASDWLAAHGAAIRAEALREAADEMPWPVTSPRAWLRGRAMAVEDAPTLARADSDLRAAQPTEGES